MLKELYWYHQQDHNLLVLAIWSILSLKIIYEIIIDGFLSFLVDDANNDVTKKI